MLNANILAYGTRARSARGSQNRAILSIICPFTGNRAFRFLSIYPVERTLPKCFFAKSVQLNTLSIGHFGKYHNTLCLSPQILLKHCYQFLLGLTTVPRENKSNAFAKFGGTDKEYYGIFPSGLYGFAVFLHLIRKYQPEFVLE